MQYEINNHINFGQYDGLSIKEIYQGTLYPDQNLIRSYLNSILNKVKPDSGLFLEIEFIDRFEINTTEIKIIGDIHDPSKPFSDTNTISFGNIQSKLSSYINSHFKNNSLGILENLRSFNRLQNEIFNIGGDPEYLEWCEREINEFKLSRTCKEHLEKLSVARLNGVHILYIGNETYSYAPKFSVETYTFKNQITTN